MTGVRIVLAIGLIALLGGRAVAQRTSPVTINPGASRGNLPSYGSNTTFSSTTVYGGFPGVYGGGFYGPGGYGGGIYGTGGYGGGVIVAPGPYGVVSPGYNLNVGPFGYGGGWSDPIQQQQRYALNNSRYELQNAQASEAYAKANFFQQAAEATARENAQAAAAATPIRERYNVRTTRAKGTTHVPKAAPTLPLDKLMTPAGKVLWPEGAPSDEARTEFDAAIAAVAKDFRDSGHAEVQDVNAARDALYAFGTPALAKVRRENPAKAPALKAFLNSMDATLIGWAK